MFEARLDQSVLFKRIIDAVKELVEQVNIECTASGMAIQAMDSTHVALIQLNLNSSAFSTYRCEPSCTLGIDVKEIQKVFKSAGADDALTLRTDSEDADILRIIFQSEGKKRLSQFDLKLMDIDESSVGITEREHDFVAQIDSGEFFRVCRDLMQLGDKFDLQGSKKGLQFHVSGDSTSGTILLQPTDAGVDDDFDEEDEEGKSCLRKLVVKAEVHLTVSGRQLMHFCKATPLSDVVELRMSSKSPLSLVYPIDKGGNLTYYLAPKKDTEEDEDEEESGSSEHEDGEEQANEEVKNEVDESESDF
ncbi:proliferating cell nuclear antigen, PCNA [Aduncisulcus paluster]|uniref:DNA sliding clamp PCNA n=1 Tax=Aduncisulcus paluster TaxID=2918883 RepID=A0ABQ5JYU6_9EUKA|nr:proliferating cell nuclear antigen, PCNA [Aduncisulcus paluster]GKT22876.1 proliferating cell nuclear antigen, PCNA [Aduncisulcus paluster]